MKEMKMTQSTTKATRWLAASAIPLLLISSMALTPARAQEAVAATQTQSSIQDKLPEGQVEQLVAPIALYPDSLLMQVLMASTYPLDVVEAARWSHDNPTLEGSSLSQTMQAQSWDPSVKALTAVPQTLQMMSDKLDWMQQLGDAFLAQQQDVLAAVQRLRTEAQAAGNLQSSQRQTVRTAPAPSDLSYADVPQPIVIEPVNPDVYYVPVYDPAVAYGAWDYPAYLPFYWSPPGFVASNVVSFAAGVAVGAAIWGGCDWWHHNVVINVNRYNVFNHASISVANNRWVHDPAHRRGIPYRNANVTSRFGGVNETTAREAMKDRIDVPRPGEFRGPEPTRSDADTKPARDVFHEPGREFNPMERDRASQGLRDFAPRGDTGPREVRSDFRADSHALEGGSHGPARGRDRF
jgi:Protein of unknown function (DUF3300)